MGTISNRGWGFGLPFRVGAYRQVKACAVLVQETPRWLWYVRVPGRQQQQVSGGHVVPGEHRAGILHGHLSHLHLRLGSRNPARQRRESEGAYLTVYHRLQTRYDGHITTAPSTVVQSTFNRCFPNYHYQVIQTPLSRVLFF